MRVLSANILLIVLLIVAACNERAPHASDENARKDSAAVISPAYDSVIAVEPAPDTNMTIEEKILDTIFKVPGVATRSKYIEEQTKGERHLKLWISGTPAESGEKYYWVTAGEDNGMSLVAHFNFHVYADSMRIMYFDVTEDREMTLKEWERREAESSKQ